MQTNQPKLPPGADVVFRRLFDEEDDCRLLISLLNALLRQPPGQRIRKLSLRRTQLAGPLSDDKEVVLDVRAECHDGRQFSIEVQVSSRPAYAARMLYYWAGIFHGQAQAGKGYADLAPVICIHILFFPLLRDPKHEAYHHVFHVRADEDGAVLSPHFELHTLEMTKFPDLKEGQEEARWLYWLKHGHEMKQDEVEALGVPEIVEADRKLIMISQDRDLRADYERRLLAQMDKQILRDARTEGRKEGLDEGKRLGRREGLRQAAADLCEALGIALTAEQAASLDALDEAGLSALCQHLKTRRCWPT